MSLEKLRLWALRKASKLAEPFKMMSSAFVPVQARDLASNNTNQHELSVSMCSQVAASGLESTGSIAQQSTLESLGMSSARLTEVDKSAVVKMMTYKPRFAYGFKPKCMCKHGFPQAFGITSPVTTVKNRATQLHSSLSRLICPLLIQHVDALEADGEIERINQQLAEDPKLQAAFAQINDRHKEIRRILYNSEDAAADRKLYESLPGFKAEVANTILDSGIIGVQSTKDIKCLHAAVADAICSGGQNVFGQHVLDRMGPISRGTDECWKRCDPEVPLPGSQQQGTSIEQQAGWVEKRLKWKQKRVNKILASAQPRKKKQTNWNQYYQRSEDSKSQPEGPAAPN